LENKLQTLEFAMLRNVILLTAALLFSSLLSAAETAEERFTFPLQAGGRISVENVNGDITVVGGTGQQVEIVATKRAKNAKALAEIEILVETSDDLVSLETRHGKSGWFGRSSNGGSVSYSLVVPANANLDSIETANGDIAVSGVDGDMEIQTVNGGIMVEDARADATLETVNGGINATFLELAGDQDVECGSVNGSISVYLPADTDARVSAETVNGGIDGSDFALETSKGMVGRDLSGNVGNGSARLELGTVNGGIRISQAPGR
jgi:DUF4097 and DUF4098 domain-containing protein YvlB